MGVLQEASGDSSRGFTGIGACLGFGLQAWKCRKAICVEVNRYQSILLGDGDDRVAKDL